MLAGRPPFSGSMVQIMSQHLTRVPPFEQMSDLPAEVVHLLEQCSRKMPAKRPQTATDLRREIEQVIQAVQASGAAAAAAKAGGGASLEAVDTSFPTQASTDGQHAGSDSSQAPAQEPASGVVLANRYRLLHEAAHSTDGSIFQALALDSGRAVAVKILAPDLVATPELFARVEAEVARVQAAPHPALLEVYTLERSGPHAFLSLEWVNGFSVLDLLRHRHSLTVHEVLQIIEPIAAGADHARANGLPAPDISPVQILLAFEAVVDLPALTALLTGPLNSWPTFHPKILALTLRSELANSSTWAGQQTIAPQVQAPGLVRQMALLSYELLGGVPVAAVATTAAGTSQRAPLPALSEEGNAVLRRALQTGGAQPAYASALGFAAALRGSLTSSPVEPPARPAKIEPAPPPIVPAAGSSAPAAVQPRESALATPTPLPVRPTAPPPLPAETAPKSRPLMAVLIILIICAFLGVLAGLGFAAWKFLLPQVNRPLAQEQASSPAPAVRRALPLETPVASASAAPSLPPVAPAVPYPGPASTATPAPIPVATPAPTPDRGARFQELLAKAQSLDQAGDAAGALDGYVTLAQDYPDQDKGLSRVDSFISGLRAAPLPGEAEQNRAQKLRPPMERAAGLGSDLAMLFLGDHLRPTEPETAAACYQKAADKGQPEAMFALGNMYFKGEGVPAQPFQTARWFQLASDRGFVPAKINLAECYDEGKGGVKQDFKKSFLLLNEVLGLDANNAIALAKLAFDYEKGRGTPPDPQRAFTLTKRAADLGNTNAMGNLGVYYMNGLGGHKDPRMAAALFRQGAEKDSAACMFYYAQCLEGGVPGTPANRAEAVSYYRAAAERGFPAARRWCQQNGISFAGE